MPPFPENKRVDLALRIASILDAMDPLDPVEIARSGNTDLEFERQNDGDQDYRGASKIPCRPDIYASDRNSGLYLFREVEPDDGDGDDIKVVSQDDDD